MTALLVKLGNTPPGDGRAEVLRDLAQAEAAQGHWEDVIDYGRLCHEEAIGNDQQGLAAQGLLLMSKAEQAQGNLAAALDLCVKASVYAQEGTMADQHISALEMAMILTNMGVHRRALEYLGRIPKKNTLSPADQMRMAVATADCYLAKEDLEQAQEQYAKALHLATASKEATSVVNCLSAMATIEARRGNYQKAIELEEDLLQLQRATGTSTEQGIVLNNLGELSEKLGRRDQASAYYLEAATLLYGVPLEHEQVLLNLAVTYGNQGQFNKAYKVLDNVQELIAKHGTSKNKAAAHNMRAELLLSGSQHTEARDEALNGDRMAVAQGSIRDRIIAHDILVRVATAKGWTKEMRGYQDALNDLRLNAERGLRKRDREREDYNSMVLKQEQDVINLVSMEQRDRLRMQQIMMDAENVGKELEISRYQNELAGSKLREEAMARERAQQALALSQAALEGERRSRTIEQLESQKTLQMLAVTKLELEKKDKETAMALLKRQNDLLESDRRLQQEAQQRDRLISRFAIVVGTVLAALCILALWTMRKLRAKNGIIRSQFSEIGTINKQLKETNEDMLSSIRYARNIQGAIIPSGDRLREILPDSFMFYRPRDVVSGDLPFIHADHGRIYTAAIDCTGHGVPAAMLSFMAYYNLIDIIAGNPDHGPAAILTELHHRVVATIGQTTEGGMMSDGMEIGLVCIRPGESSVRYAGAGIGLVIEHDGEVERVKGDPRSVGDRFAMEDILFREHMVQLNEDDKVYLYSDGLIHQFGGETGHRKLSHRRVSWHLSALRDKQPDQALSMTDVMFSEWMGAEEQTDDVLLIGFSLKGTRAVKAA